MPTDSTLMTEGGFLALPDDDELVQGLIRGVLRERPTLTTRGYARGVVLGRIAASLTRWSAGQQVSRGFVLARKARIRLRRDVATFLGVDVAYFEARSKPYNFRKTRFVEGPPILAVEIISPSDTHEGEADKVEEYLDAGVPLVWIVDTVFSTVTVRRPDAKPQHFNADQEISAEPFLPGFRVRVAEFFEDLEG